MSNKWLSGYTCIPNELLCREGLTTTERNILFIILSYQFLNEGKEFSERYLATLIGVNDKKVIRKALLTLQAQDLIIKTKESDKKNSEGAHYMANCRVQVSFSQNAPNHQNNGSTEKKQDDPGVKNDPPWGEKRPTLGRKTTHPGVKNDHELSNNINNKKNNNKKREIDASSASIISPDLFSLIEFWNQEIDKRKKSTKIPGARVLTGTSQIRLESILNKCMKEIPISELKQAITNYFSFLEASPWYKHRWSLKEFLLKLVSGERKASKYLPGEYQAPEGSNPNQKMQEYMQCKEEYEKATGEKLVSLLEWD